MQVHTSRIKVSRRVAGVLATTALAFPFGVLGGAQAANADSSARVGCYGDYCSGQDPMSTGCATGAYTTTYKDIPGGQIQVRWSPTCKTNWARLVQYPGCAYMGDLVARQDTGYTQHKWIGIFVCVSQTTTDWTPMIYSPVRRVRAEIGGYVTPWS